jgi:hypothetical protein
MDWAMFGLFRPLEEYVVPPILTVGALCFVIFLGFMLNYSLEVVCLPFAERDISTPIWILEHYYFDLKVSVLP